MGIDLDRRANKTTRGCARLRRSRHTVSIDDHDRVVQWNTDGRAGKMRVGFMTRVSPGGRYVVSTFTGNQSGVQPGVFTCATSPTYKFLQVFYPTKGILEWYDRETGRRQPLPGADDPKYVQTSGVWSPDGKWVVFERALAREACYQGQAAGHVRQRSQRDADSIRSLPGAVQRRQGRRSRSGLWGRAENGMSNSFPPR